MNFVIKNNTFFQTGGSGVIIGKMYNALVENNDFNQTGYSNGTETRLAGRGSGMWTFRCKHVIAQYNRSYDVKGNGDSYGMHIDFGNEDVIYQYNYSQNSEGGFCEILGSNNRCVYRFNVSVNDGYRNNHGNTIWISGFVGSGNSPIRSNNSYIYNNTIYYTENYSPNIEIYARNTYIYNNAFMTTGGASIGSEGPVIDIANGSLRVSNNYFKGNISTNFQNRDNNKIVDAWPGFHDASSLEMEGFKIYSGSPMVDAGKSFSQPAFPMAGQGIFSSISAHPEEDAFGNWIDIENQAPNIGVDNNHSSNLITSVLDNEINDYLFKLSPTLVQNSLTIGVNNEVAVYDIAVLNLKGEIVYQLDNLNAGETKIILPPSIKNGMYLLQVSISSEKIQTSKFVLYR